MRKAKQGNDLKISLSLDVNLIEKNSQIKF